HRRASAGRALLLRGPQARRRLDGARFRPGQSRLRLPPLLTPSRPLATVEGTGAVALHGRDARPPGFSAGPPAPSLSAWGAAGERSEGSGAGRAMRTYRIAVVGGDGIGPEVIGRALDVLAEACRAASGFALEFVEAPAG